MILDNYVPDERMCLTDNDVDAAGKAMDLLQSKLSEAAHTDHLIRHHDRTCPACQKPEPVAWIAKQEDGGLLLWDSSYKLIQEGYEFNKHKRLKYYPLYLGK